MSLLISGRITAFTLLVVLWLLTIFFYYQSKKGKQYQLRKLTAVDAIKEAVDRATEMGRPVHYTPGDRGITRLDAAPSIVASLSILKYVAQMCARSGTRLIVTLCMADILSLVEENVRSAYIAENKLEAYNAEDIIWFGNEQHSYTTGVQALMYRENVGANLMIGNMASESVIMPEVAARVGAMQIGGTAASGATVANWAIACDYTLMADELFVAAAEVSQDPVLQNNIRVSDVAKIGFLAIVVLGCLLMLAGNSVIKDLLGS